MAAFRTLLASLVILAGGLGALHGATDGFRAFTTETARRNTVRDHPPVVPSVRLEAADGTDLNFEALRGRWLVVDFIYTRCTMLCSLQGTEFGWMQQALSDPIAAGRVVLLSVSFDPAHDDPAALQQYLHSHGGQAPGWLAARPVDADGLTALLHAFGIIVIPDGMGGFMHNAATLVVDPAGRLVGVFDWDDSAGALRYVTEQLAS